MKLDEIRATLVDGAAADWHVVDGFPTYRDNLNAIVDGLENLESHSKTAAYMPDVNLTLAWGMDPPGDENPHLPGSPGASLGAPFPDKSVSSFQVDVFYAGSLVDRHYGVHLDGYRAALPYPMMQPLTEPDEDDQSFVWTVSPWEVELFRLISDLWGNHEYDSYLERSPIFIED